MPSRHATAPLPSTQDAVQQILSLLYSRRKGEWQTFEKRERNAEIYRRYLAGKNSVVLARVYGLSDRRIRDIIEHERKRENE